MRHNPTYGIMGLCRYRHNTHWSGAKPRLNRELGKRFGDHAYAVEELVAELGSAFLCGSLSITPQPRADHASYIAHWLEVMKADTRAIFSAAAKANEAVTFLRAAVPDAT